MFFVAVGTDEPKNLKCGVAEPTTAAVPPPPPPLLLLLLLLLLLCRYSLLRAFLKTQNEKQQSVVTVCAPRCIAGREAAAGQ